MAPNARRTRPRRLAATLAAVALCGGVTSACGYQPVPPDRLELGNQPVYAHCAAPQKGRTWAQIQNSQTEFGLDDLVVKGDQPITVTKVDIVPHTSRLHLTDVVFVPLGGSVESGFEFGDVRAVDDKTAWDKRAVLPATLTTLHPSAALKADFPDSADQWQVVVAVQPTGENDTADAIALTYTVGGRKSVLVGRHSFAVAKTQADCNKDTGG